MGYGSDDLYYNPESFGLTTLGEIEWSPGCYDFDLTVVWKDGNGIFYWASDSGCSCPSPFEDYTSLDADGVESGTKWEALKAVMDMLGNPKDNEYAAPQVAELCAKIVGAL